jgi:hypothetical protein
MSLSTSDTTVHVMIYGMIKAVHSFLCSISVLNPEDDYGSKWFHDGSRMAHKSNWTEFVGCAASIGRIFCRSSVAREFVISVCIDHLCTFDWGAIILIEFGELNVNMSSVCSLHVVRTM